MHFSRSLKNQGIYNSILANQDCFFCIFLHHPRLATSLLFKIAIVMGAGGGSLFQSSVAIN